MSVVLVIICTVITFVCLAFYDDYLKWVNKKHEWKKRKYKRAMRMIELKYKTKA